MARKLVMIALCGFGVAAVSGVIALSLDRGGSRDFGSFGRRAYFRLPMFGDFSHRCPDEATDAQFTTRTLPWTDQSGTIELSLPANVSWTPGAARSVVVTGRAGAANWVEISGNKISISCTPKDWEDLEIALPGQNFSHITADGLTHLHLTGLNQPELDLDISGAATATATGVVPINRLNVSGAANIDESNLLTQELHADLSGASVLIANPAQSADINLSGVGVVTLLTRPRDYHATISGIGRVNLPDQQPAYQ